MVLTDSYSRVAASFMDADEAMELLGIKGTGDFAKDRKMILGLAKQYHSDLNPDKEAERKMLAVNSLLSQFIQEKEPLPTGTTRSRQPSHPQEVHPSGIPPWQTDSRSSHNSFREGDFRNINFCKKFIYEHALQAEEGDRLRLQRIHLWSFEGAHGRESMEVFGSRKIYQLMADVMRQWAHPDAVLVSDAWGKFKVIWVAGHDVDIPIEHESFNLNAFNDRDFERKIQNLVRQYR